MLMRQDTSRPTFIDPDDEGFWGPRVEQTITGTLHTHVMNFKADFDLVYEKNTFVKTDIVVENITQPWFKELGEFVRDVVEEHHDYSSPVDDDNGDPRPVLTGCITSEFLARLSAIPPHKIDDEKFVELYNYLVEKSEVEAGDMVTFSRQYSRLTCMTLVKSANEHVNNSSSRPSRAERRRRSKEKEQANESAKDNATVESVKDSSSAHSAPQQAKQSPAPEETEAPEKVARQQAARRIVEPVQNLAHPILSARPGRDGTLP